MASIKLSSMSAQLASHLHAEIVRGRWKNHMPGRDTLALKLAVSPKIVACALTILERDGIIEPQGAGRRRKILVASVAPSRSLRIAILISDPKDTEIGYMVDLKRRLDETGHQSFFLKRGTRGEPGSPQKLDTLVAKTKADAWILVSAPREVLQWFVTEGIACFALFGRRHSVPIASTGPDKSHAMRIITERLLELGHRRIVMLVKHDRRLPEPGAGERDYLKMLEAAGIATSAYNLPEWTENARGLQQRLESMFRITPPTAIIVDGPPLFFSVQHQVTRMGYQVPDDVSLICTDGDPYFVWQYPTIAHIRWDSRPWIKHAVKWAQEISQGKIFIKKHSTQCDFVDGGTIGPAKKQA